MAKIFTKTVPRSPLSTDESNALAQIPKPATIRDAEQAYIHGKAFNQALEVDRALEMLERAVVLDPKHDKAVIELGRTLVDLGRNEDAVTLFEETLDAHPEIAEVRLQFAACLLRMGRLERAADECQRCREDRPNWNAPHQTEIMALCRSGQPEAAKAVLKDLMRFDPDERTVRMLEQIITKNF